MRHQPRVTRCQRTPDLHHQTVVICSVTDLAEVFTLTQIGDQVIGCDNRFGLEDHGGRNDPHGGTECLGYGMYFRQVLAVGAHALPDEGNRVQTEDVYPFICQPEDQVNKLEEHVGIGPVEVPLPGVERRPDPVLAGVIPRKIAGREIREDFRQRALKLVGHGAIREKIEVITVFLIAILGLARPFVFLRDVVQHQVAAQADALGVQGAGEFLKVFYRAQVGAHLAKIRNRVPTVVRGGAGLQERHQVQVFHAQVFKVTDLVQYAFEVARKAFRVADVSDHFRAFKPVGCEGAFQVEAAQFGVAGLMMLEHDAEQPGQHWGEFGSAVDGFQPVQQVGQ